jgi:hypothetical protein
LVEKAVTCAVALVAFMACAKRRTPTNSTAMATKTTTSIGEKPGRRSTPRVGNDRVPATGPQSPVRRGEREERVVNGW